MNFKNIQEHILEWDDMNRYNCPDWTLQQEPQLFNEVIYDICNCCGGHHEIIDVENELCQGCVDEEDFDGE